MKKYVRVNKKIRVSQVRLIDEEGEQFGIVPLEEALQKAKEADKDLVEVAPQAKPPVCKIMNFSKYKYEQQKKERAAKKHQQKIVLKEIKLRSRTEEHDIQFKLNHAKKFLKKGNKVKISLMFRGREMTHKDIGRDLVNRFIEQLSDFGQIEVPLKQQGRFLMVILEPIKEKN